MSEQEILENLRTYAVATCRLFSNKNKDERERMAFRTFLRCLGEGFRDEEIVKGEHEPVDIAFRDATFQLIELLDEGRRRGDELKRRQERYEAASSLEDVSDPYVPSRPLSLTDLPRIIERHLQDKACRYGAADLDILVHVDLLGRHLYPTEGQLSLHGLQSQRWRSVSFLWLPYAVVLYAHEDAPPFLREASGSARSEWPRPDGWFDP